MNNISAEPHRRRSKRLNNYDYSSPGVYYSTISTCQKFDLLGKITRGKMILNEYGKMLQTVWTNIPSHYPGIFLDSFVIMPNHFHGLIRIKDRADLKSAPTKKCSLAEIVRSFKAFSTREINEVRNTPGSPIWQRNYYERIVRNENELNAIREYINTNVINWPLDKENV